MEILKSLNYTPAKVKAGCTDRILHIDLSTNNIEIEELPPEFKYKYIGGRGYCLKLIWDGTTKATKYDSPENILVMAHGPLGADPAFPGTGKFIVGTISPLTGTFIDSNIGGHFGPLLKLTGFDALAVTGIAKEDVVLSIDGDAGTIDIARAPQYDSETNEGSLSFGDKLLRDANNGELSDNFAAVTAGKGGLYSRFGIINSLFFDRRRDRLRSKQAGRGGTGTVMRTKGLRAVIVHSSLNKANANNPVDKEGVRAAGSELKKVIYAADPTQLRLGDWGTTGLSAYMDKFHLFPVRNYQYGQDPESPKLFAEVFLKNYFDKDMPDGCCYGCNLACAKAASNVLLTRGPYAGRKVDIDGPEYETVGAVCCMGIFDPQFVMEYNWYCDEYGLDTISTGVTTAFFMECVSRGYLNAGDIGYDLSFGNVDSANRLLHEIANGTGFGKVVGQGVARGKDWVARKYAAETGKSYASIKTELDKFGMEVKGLEFSMYITKESLAQQGGYGFALKGAQHDEAWLIFIDQVNNEVPSLEQKANALKWFPLIRTWFNANGLCKLQWIDVRNPEAAKTPEPAKNIPTMNLFIAYQNATMGTSKKLQDILDDSERLGVLQKLINLRMGRGTRASDQLPLRAMAPAFMNEYDSRAAYYDEWLAKQTGAGQIPTSPEAKHKLLVEKRKEAYQQLCDIVYEKKGYNSQAVPKRETVQKFDLLDAQADALLKEFGV